MTENGLKKISKHIVAHPDYITALRRLGLNNIDTVFDFQAGTILNKKNLAKYRHRRRFKIQSPPTVVFLKRYNKPPRLKQLRNWLDHRQRASTAFFDHLPTVELAKAGINTPKTIALGEKWNLLFERKSFIMTGSIPQASSLEQALPSCFDTPQKDRTFEQKKHFLAKLADFIKKFHDTGYRHRDLYLCHIFLTEDHRLYLMDLARAFKPLLLNRRFLIKDLAQLHYSAPANKVSNADRLRFYKLYTENPRLSTRDRAFIKKIHKKALAIAKHDKKHHRNVPFQNKPTSL